MLCYGKNAKITKASLAIAFLLPSFREIHLLIYILYMLSRYFRHRRQVLATNAYVAVKRRHSTKVLGTIFDTLSTKAQPARLAALTSDECDAEYPNWTFGRSAQGNVHRKEANRD